MGTIDYKSLFKYPAILVLLNVPISVDYDKKRARFSH
jgi:hypothetical protein